MKQKEHILMSVFKLRQIKQWQTAAVMINRTRVGFCARTGPFTGLVQGQLQFKYFYSIKAFLQAATCACLTVTAVQ